MYDNEEPLQWACAMAMVPHTESHPRRSQFMHGSETLVTMGISGVEGHAGQTIAIRWYKMLCIGSRWITMNHYSGLEP